MSATRLETRSVSHDADFVAGLEDEAVPVFDTAGARDVYCPTPSVKAVDGRLKPAMKCSMDGFDEPSWMSLVHTPLTMVVLENKVWEGKVDFIPCFVQEADSQTPSLASFFITIETPLLPTIPFPFILSSHSYLKA
jgi:hypothetical protein